MTVRSPILLVYPHSDAHLRMQVDDAKQFADNVSQTFKGIPIILGGPLKAVAVLDN